jgi:hypothetical protein
MVGDPPSLHQLMSTILQQATALHGSGSATTLNRRFVSLMADGIRKRRCMAVQQPRDV